MSKPLNDRFARLLGFNELERGDGFSKVAATPTDDSLNGADIVHGAYIFALADYAFALASNTDERLALSANASISYIAPCPLGDPLTATANIVAEAGRGAIYDIIVAGASGKTYAVFHARASYKFSENKGNS